MDNSVFGADLHKTELSDSENNKHSNIFLFYKCDSKVLEQTFQGLFQVHKMHWSNSSAMHHHRYNGSEAIYYYKRILFYWNWKRNKQTNAKVREVSKKETEGKQNDG